MKGLAGYVYSSFGRGSHAIHEVVRVTPAKED